MLFFCDLLLVASMPGKLWSKKPKNSDYIDIDTFYQAIKVITCTDCDKILTEMLKILTVIVQIPCPL